MNKIKILLIATICFTAFNSSCAAQECYNQKLDCFSILVGKNASSDGSVIAAHNEDTGTELVNFYKVPASDHQPGEEILFNTGGRTPQSEHTLGYLWINLPVCDVCDTYIISDAREGWIMNVVNGKHWVAARVPDDEIAVIPNSYTIREVNLADTANFLGSSDLIDYAAGRGWYNSSADGEFIFTKAYSSPGSLTHPDNINRMWRAMELLSGRKYDVNGVLPFSFKPEKKVEITDVMQVLRDHYEGTELDKSQHYTKGNPHRVNSGTICSGGSQYSVVAHLRPWLPVEIGTLAWIAPFRPCSQAYTAWYPAITGIPSRYAQGDFGSALEHHFDPAFSKGEDKHHAFRIFVSLVDAVDIDYGKFILPVQGAWRSFEEVNFRDQDRFEEAVLEVYIRDPEKALQVLTDYSSQKAVEVYRKAGKMIHKLK
jgi:dipeptidase